MNAVTPLKPRAATRSGPAPAVTKDLQTLEQSVIEIMSDSGEGAQKCGQSFGSIAARMGNGVWTVEIIPAEIQPPARSVAGASGNRIRIGSQQITNGGDEADIAVAFNEQVLLGSRQCRRTETGCIILLESVWAEHDDAKIVAQYAHTRDRLLAEGFRLYEVPMEKECRALVADPRKGKNMFVLGMLCNLYSMDMDLAREQIAFIFGKKDQKVILANIALLEAGWNWAETNLDFKYRVPAVRATIPQVVINGNTALALGVLASGMDICAMYPITPATSASHYLSDVFERAGGIVHQAEDEIAACAFAIGASYTGKVAVTITSGPGYSLKQEGLGLAVMAEIPLVVVNVQRGGPSTGQPTKVEQGDLLTVMFGSHGDAPKVVFAPSTIEDCFYSMITARRLAETLNMVVVVLTDASLATAQQPFARPQFSEDWLAPPVDQSPVPEGAKPYDWDPVTGLSRRFVPGQPNGMHTLTGLAHDRSSRVAYDPEINEQGMRARSHKLITLQKMLAPPPVFGDREGELLVVGWGSTKGAIEEAVSRLRAEGHQVSSTHLTFLQPMHPGIKEILQGFRQVVAIEGNWSDDPAEPMVDESNRRYSALAMLLRARYLVDVDCWTEVRGRPIKPGTVYATLRARLTAKELSR
jgi:2-oxoglutarate/2-oxoacid ferredoxin oxidoreductase subunit alpha